MRLTPIRYAPRSRSSQAGFSLIELLLTIGLIVAVAAATLLSLSGRRNTFELKTTAERMTALLREAQSRSLTQASSSTWGVHFDNGTTPFFALFSGTYSTSSRENYYPLPERVGYATTSIAAGTAAEVTFAQISGAASGSSSISIYLRQDPQSSSTIVIDPTGAVAY